MANKGSSGGHGYHHHQPEQQQQQQISFAMIHPSSSSSSSSMHASFMRSKESSSGAYDLGELDQALFMYLDGQDHSVQEQRRFNFMCAETLNIFPSQPMHVEPPSNYKGGGISLLAISPSSSGSKKSNSEQAMELDNSKKLDSPAANLPHDHAKDPKSAAPVKKEGSRKGATCSADHEVPKTPDPKTLRRLAQNREAARKSRLRKKAYIQQLETSRMKLSQIEQELHRARSQGLLYGGGGGGGLLGDQGFSAGGGGLSSDAAAMFDMEYGRWQEEHHRLMMELRAAVQEHPPENKLRVFVDSCVAHYDQMTSLRSIAIKTDVFHLLSGTWLTPAERCFMWMGGFRPSDLLKMLLSHIEPLTEQQLLAVCGLQQSTHETEEALSQGHGALNQSLLDAVTSDALSFAGGASVDVVGNYMGQMAAAMNKLATLEEFVRQADHLRQQTLHRLYQFLTTRQMARCLLAVAEYFHRLRALSSLWVARPRQE